MIRPLARAIGTLMIAVLFAAAIIVGAVVCSLAVLVGGAWVALVGPKRSMLIQLLDRLSKTE